MKNKAKKKCKKYKHTIGVNNGFCTWQVRYRTKKEQEFRDRIYEEEIKRIKEKLL